MIPNIAEGKGITGSIAYALPARIESVCIVRMQSAESRPL